MFYLIMSLFWKMIYHHSVLRDICNDFLFDFGQIVRYLKPKPNLQSNYELTKVKKYTWVVFLRILEQIWNPFSFKSFSLFHTRLSLEAFVLFIITLRSLANWATSDISSTRENPGGYHKTLFDFYLGSTDHQRSEINRTNPVAIVILVTFWTPSPKSLTCL